MGLELCREIGYRLGEVGAGGNLGNALFALGRWEESLAHHERGLEVAREVGDRANEAGSLEVLGLTHLHLGDLGVARETLEASHSLWAAIGSQTGVANLLLARGALEERAGEASTAERLDREALALRRGAGNSKKVAETLAALGSLLGSLGRVEEARVHLTEALALARALNAAPEAVFAATHLALLPGGDPAAAIEAFMAHESRLDHHAKMEARFLLWKATGDHFHLDAAHELLVHLRDHAPPECRDTMIVNVPLHRDIQAAWEAHGR